MNPRIFAIGLSIAFLPAAGCNPKGGDGTPGDDANADGDNNDGAEDIGESGDPGSGGGSDRAEADTAEDDSPDDDDGSTDGTDEGCNFLCPVDGGDPQCDLWSQDCPEGEKCIAWASDGGTWNATRCAEIDANPGQVGDECTAEGGGASGDDTCGLGFMCWDVDPETNMGTCVAQCTGDPSAGICEDSDTTCAITNDGAIQLCLPVCNPLLQDCVSENQACYPVNDSFACAPDASPSEATSGTPCAFINVCPPGLICMGPEAYGPDCDSGDGCCASVCDVTEVGGTCPGSGQSCESWYEEGEAPPGYDNVGACVVPA